jgi:hypothetical protein
MCRPLEELFVTASTNISPSLQEKTLYRKTSEVPRLRASITLPTGGNFP